MFLTTVVKGFSSVGASVQSCEFETRGQVAVAVAVFLQEICTGSTLLVSGFQRLTETVLSFYIAQGLSNLFCNLVHGMK